MICERCGAPPPEDYGLHNYCAKCSKNLCQDCMDAGCCGLVPAQDGEAENEEEDEAAKEE